jgi:lipooligosaccharide transport system permease protein
MIAHKRGCDGSFNTLLRFVVTPLFLFAGTFFPVRQLPDLVEPLAYATPLWHGVELARGLALGTAEVGPATLHVAYLSGWIAVGTWLAARAYQRRLAV